ncbi:MAG TPA: DUF4173 domain-containing protein [Allosphingosinicella sp.]|jgi:hypothetical protein
MEIAAPAPAALPAWRRRPFLEKAAAALALAAIADSLFFLQRSGATLGAFAVLLLAALLLTVPALRRRRSSLLALAAAALFALALLDDPSLLAVVLFWGAAATAVLLPRTAAFDHAGRWLLRLFVHLATAPAAPPTTFARFRQARARAGGARFTDHLPKLWLPLVGSLVFLALFAAANPLIGDAFARADIALLFGGFSLMRLLFWVLIVPFLWALFRPRHAGLRRAAQRGPSATLPGVSLASVTLSLLAFNAIFALQNGLDIAFLWSGAPLPGDLTLAAYAHRGAYPLIATALLAGLFVLVTLRPGTDTAASPLVRRLVYLWIAQNVLLVASTMLRTFDYIDSYSLTRLRIAALLWMALVAIGLTLICIRIWREKSGAWLINANALAALLALSACAFVDLGALAASWNVRHAREAGGRGVHLDLCYLGNLGPSALLPVLAMESRPLAPAYAERLAWVRNSIMDGMERDQSDWHGWTYRNHRRLAEAKRQIAERRLQPRQHVGSRHCDGNRFDTPALPVTAPAPLTAPAAR